MFKFFKKNPPVSSLYEVAYKFVGSDKVYTDSATSAGLASLRADFLVEIIDVQKVGA